MAYPKRQYTCLQSIAPFKFSPPSFPHSYSKSNTDLIKTGRSIPRPKIQHTDFQQRTFVAPRWHLAVQPTRQPNAQTATNNRYMKQQNHFAANDPRRGNSLPGSPAARKTQASLALPVAHKPPVHGFLPLTTVICHSMYYALYSTY